MHFTFDTVKILGFKRKVGVMHFTFDTKDFTFDTGSVVNSFIYKEIASG